MILGDLDAANVRPQEWPGVVVCLIYDETYQYEDAALRGRYKSDRLSSNSITA